MLCFRRIGCGLGILRTLEQNPQGFIAAGEFRSRQRVKVIFHPVRTSAPGRRHGPNNRRGVRGVLVVGHARSTLVDSVYAHSLQSGMASVAERVTALALGEQPKLRVIDGGQRDVRQPLEETLPQQENKQATG